MIVGIGVDLVDIDRVDSMLRRHPERALSRLFTATERQYCLGSKSPAESFAARFAAKEALFKALGTGWTSGVSWQEVEVQRELIGAPGIVLYGSTRQYAIALGVRNIHLSLTHSRSVACAYVILEGGDNQPERD